MTVRHDGLTVDWFGYATVRLAAGDTVVYLDPGRYGVLTGEWEPGGRLGPDGEVRPKDEVESDGAFQADEQARADSAFEGDGERVPHPPARDRRPHDGDVVCVSHVHHYDPDGIERVAGPDATVLAFEGIDVHASDRDLQRPATLPYDVVSVGMEDEAVAGDVPVWTVPAYNDPDGPNVKPDGTPYHPRGIGCGFLLALDGTRVFWPGDSDVLAGHAELDVSLFLPSIARNFTMDRHAAAALAGEMDPDLVLPVHYNTFESLRADSAAFAADVAGRGVPVVLDER